jgi:hypothetical protein
MAEIAAEEGSEPVMADGARTTLVKLATVWVRVSGVLDQMQDLFRRWATQMAHWADSESPPPDSERDRRSLEDMLTAAARIGAQRATVEIRSQHTEGGNGRGNGGDKSWKEKVVMPLIVVAIGGAIVTYAKVASLETTIRNYHEEDLRRDQQRHEENERRFQMLERKAFP